MVKVPTGGRKKKLNASTATSEVTTATRSGEVAATTRTMSRNVVETVAAFANCRAAGSADNGERRRPTARPAANGNTSTPRSVTRLVIGEPVSDPRFGQDVSSATTVCFDLLAQRADQYAQMFGLIDRVRAPIAFRIVRCVSTRPGCCAGR